VAVGGGAAVRGGGGVDCWVRKNQVLSSKGELEKPGFQVRGGLEREKLIVIGGSQASADLHKYQGQDCGQETG